MIAERRDQIRTVRVFGASPDPLALRIGLERELGPLTLMPRGVPPGAVLCVRRLRVTHDARARDLSQQVDGQLLDMLHGVARPLHQAVPADAPAVLFLDEAELLACLARDVALGAAHAWWWRSLFDAPPSRDIVVRELLHTPHAVPAAFALLAQSDQAVAVLRTLPDGACERIGAAVASAFALTPWTTAQPEVRPAPRDGDVPPVDVMHAIARARAILLLECADYVARTLPLPQRALLGVSVLLHHAPALARSSAVIRALEREAWTIAPSAPSAAPLPVATNAAHAFHAARPHDQNADAVTEPRAHMTPAPAASPVSGGAGVKRAQERVASADARGEGSTTTALAPSSHDRDPAAAALRSVLHGSAPAAVASAYAGVFYLVNAAIALELYGDFTQPLRPGIALPLGDFLALTGERACGAAFRRDPVWPLLAELAGRDVRERPGAGFLPARPLQRWLTSVTTQLSRRASSALGVAPRTSLRYLCARDGRIVLSATRIDVTFPLATHPLPIRVAGLDRNPGWVPAAGRILEFHYDL